MSLIAPKCPLSVVITQSSSQQPKQAHTLKSITVGKMHFVPPQLIQTDAGVFHGSCATDTQIQEQMQLKQTRSLIDQTCKSIIISSIQGLGLQSSY